LRELEGARGSGRERERENLGWSPTKSFPGNPTVTQTLVKLKAKVAAEQKRTRRREKEELEGAGGSRRERELETLDGSQPTLFQETRL
jgi:hypothetical protein